MCLFKPELKIVYSFKFFILKKPRRERNAKYCTNADAMGDEINLRMRFFLGGGGMCAKTKHRLKNAQAHGAKAFQGRVPTSA